MSLPGLVPVRGLNVAQITAGLPGHCTVLAGHVPKHYFLNALPWSMYYMYGAAMVRSIQIPGVPGPPCAYLWGTETRRQLPPACCHFFLNMLAFVMSY